MSHHGEIEPRSDRVARLERKAAAARERLLRAIDALDARRRQVVKIGAKAKSLAVPAALSVVAVTSLFGASVLFFGLAIRERRRRSFSYRAKRALAGAGIELAPRASLLRRLVEKGALTLVSIAAAELGKIASKNLADGRFPNGRLALAGPRRSDIGVEVVAPTEWTKARVD